MVVRFGTAVALAWSPAAACRWNLEFQPAWPATGGLHGGGWALQPQRTAQPCISALTASPHTAGLQDQSTETQTGRRPVLDAPAMPLAECPRIARTCHPLRLLWGGGGGRAGTQGWPGLHLGPGRLLPQSPGTHTLTSLRITFLLEAFLGTEPLALRTSTLSVPQGHPKGRSSLVPGQPVLGAEMSSSMDKPLFYDDDEVSFQPWQGLKGVTA